MDFICMPEHLCSEGFNNIQFFVITVYVSLYVTIKVNISKDAFHKLLSTKMLSTDDYKLQGESIFT